MANMIFNLDLNKNNAINPMIFGRLTDGNLRKITVNITNEGEPVNLTDWVIRFEGMTGGQAKVFDVLGVNILDAENGRFEYTFSKRAFSATGAYRYAYFSIEKDDMRETTNDIKIIVENVADLDAQDAETVVTELNKTITLINQKYDELNGRVDIYEGDIVELENWLDERKTEIENIIESANSTFNQKLSEIQAKLDKINQAIEKGSETIAYAYSADGTDRFTTVYPNLNLLTDSKDFINKDLSGNNQKTSIVSPNSTVLKDGNDTYLNFISTADNQYWLDAYLVSDWSTTPQPDFINANILPNSKYTFSFWAKGTGDHKVHSWDNWTTPSNIITTFTLTNEWKYYSFTVTSSATIPVKNVEFFLRSLATGTEINVKYPKVEQGSTATPWMPSSSEVKTSDYPSYIGYSNTVKTNKVANDYKWFPTIDSHTSNKNNPHAVTASQTGAYTKAEVATLISEAIKQSKLDANPIGTILTTISGTNPSTYIGGTWERYGQGRVLVGVDENDVDFSEAGITGGEKEHTLTTDEMPSHAHSMGRTANSGSSDYNGQKIMGTPYNSSFYPSSAATNPTGGDKAHNNMQPYTTVYMFRRIA